MTVRGTGRNSSKITTCVADIQGTSKGELPLHSWLGKSHFHDPKCVDQTSISRLATLDISLGLILSDKVSFHRAPSAACTSIIEGRTAPLHNARFAIARQAVGTELCLSDWKTIRCLPRSNVKKITNIRPATP